MKLSQFAVGNFAHGLYSFESFLKATDPLPVRNLELWAAWPHAYLDDCTLPQLSALRRRIAQRGLQVICVTPEQCMYPINIGSDDPVTRRRSLRYFRRGLQAAAILESPRMLVTVGQSLRDHDRETAVQLTAEALDTLAGEAAPLGVALVVEHLTKTTTNVAVTAAELAAVVAAAGNHDNLWGMVDTDMAARVGEEPVDYLRAFGGRLGHVHLVDGLPGGHLVPGDGVLPVARLLDQLDAAGYNKTITLEVTNERYALDPDEALRRSVRFVEDYLAARRGIGPVRGREV